MGLSIDQLVQVLSEDEVFETFLTILETLQIPARSWRIAGVARTILRVVARTYAGFTQLMSAAIKGAFLETSADDWLTLLARYVYGVERIQATFAAGQLQFTNNGGGVFSFQAGEVRALSVISKKAYVNTAAFTLNPGEVKSVPFAAVELGSGSSAPAGTITALETVLPRVTVTNPVALVGTDAESDADLQQRCADRRGTWSGKGPRSAYADAVRSARRPDGSPVGVNRLSVSPSSSTGIVTIYAASPSGAPVATDLDVIRESIEELARPDTVTVSLLPAFEVPLTANLIAWARRGNGVVANDIATAAQTALISAISKYPIGGIKKNPGDDGMLYAEFVKAIVQNAHTAIFDVDGFDTDIAIKAGAVVTLGATVAVNLVDVEAA